VAPLLTISELQVEFRERTGDCVRALRGASLRVNAGEVVGVLGESGCGKSTLAKTLLQLLPPVATVTGGQIELSGRSLLEASPREMSAIRGARISLVPQEPGLALSPYLKVGKQIAEVLRAHKDWNRRRCYEEADQLLSLTQLGGGGRRMFDAYPHQLSGGEQQRVVIAQAIACGPELVVADEPAASLDSETAAGILELLRDLRRRFRMSLLFITHSPRILDGLADHIAVMYAGRVVEEGPAVEMLTRPRHPYTQALLACGRRVEFGVAEDAHGTLPAIRGDAPDGRRAWQGCAFAERCGSRIDGCDEHAPPRVEQPEAGSVECVLYGS
jgi:oligopeptide/dipeptide ABC transporter ATP-binding protein